MAERDRSDFAKLVTDLLSLILKITGIVYSTVENSIKDKDTRASKKWDDDKKGWDPSKNNNKSFKEAHDGKDKYRKIFDERATANFTLSCMTIDNTIIQLCLSLLLGATFASKAPMVGVSMNGTVTTTGDRIDNATVQQDTKTSSPTLAISQKIWWAKLCTFIAGYAPKISSWVSRQSSNSYPWQEPVIKQEVL